MDAKFEQWHHCLRALLESAHLMSPTQFSRAVLANGGLCSRQVAWRWINGHGIAGAGNVLPICRSLNLEPHSNEEAAFIRTWLRSHLAKISEAA